MTLMRTGVSKQTLVVALIWIYVQWIFSPSLQWQAFSVQPLSSSSSSQQQQQPLRRRKFVSYHSSAWERQWLELAQTWDARHDYTNYSDSILHQQQPAVHDFLKATCTEQLPAPYEHWCVQNDFHRPFFYNTQNTTTFEWYCSTSPQGRQFQSLVPRAKSLGPLQPSPEYQHIFSYFTFVDEVTGETFIEYIEPLVAGLRHPLARLHNGGMRGPNNVLEFRGYVLPPPPPPQRRHDAQQQQRRIYLDAGASQWGSGLGGPSLSYFTSTWARQGLELNEIYAYEPTTSVEKFHSSVPHNYKARTKFWQTSIASSPETATANQPFLPLFIKNVLQPDINDYVLWKLDIDSPDVEDGSIQYLLLHDDIHVDEIAWEHHVRDHPVMGKIWAMGNGPPPASLTLRQSYDFFLKLRQKGIRAHSWV